MTRRNRKSGRKPKGRRTHRRVRKITHRRKRWGGDKTNISQSKSVLDAPRHVDDVSDNDAFTTKRSNHDKHGFLNFGQDIGSKRFSRSNRNNINHIPSQGVILSKTSRSANNIQQPDEFRSDTNISRTNPDMTDETSDTVETEFSEYMGSYDDAKLGKGEGQIKPNGLFHWGKIGGMGKRTRHIRNRHPRKNRKRQGRTMRKRGGGEGHMVDIVWSQGKDVNTKNVNDTPIKRVRGDYTYRNNDQPDYNTTPLGDGHMEDVYSSEGESEITEFVDNTPRTGVRGDYKYINNQVSDSDNYTPETRDSEFTEYPEYHQYNDSFTGSNDSTNRSSISSLSSSSTPSPIKSSFNNARNTFKNSTKGIRRTVKNWLGFKPKVK